MSLHQDFLRRYVKETFKLDRPRPVKEKDKMVDALWKRIGAVRRARDGGRVGR